MVMSSDGAMEERQSKTTCSADFKTCLTVAALISSLSAIWLINDSCEIFKIFYLQSSVKFDGF